MEGNLAKVKKFSDNLDIYNDCPTWRLGLFALNNIATNLYMFAMGYISMYYLQLLVLY